MSRQYVKGEVKRPMDVVNILYSDNSKVDTAEASYSNEKCTIFKVNKHKFRSLDALHEIAEGYFPGLTLDDFIKEFIREKRYYCMWCSDIGNITVVNAASAPKDINRMSSEGSVKYSQYRDKYSAYAEDYRNN